MKNQTAHLTKTITHKAWDLGWIKKPLCQAEDNQAVSYWDNEVTCPTCKAKVEYVKTWKAYTRELGRVASNLNTLTEMDELKKTIAKLDQIIFNASLNVKELAK